MSKQISALEFTKLVNEGKTKAELAELYELTPANIANVAQQLNLKFKRKVLPKFEIVYDLDSAQDNTVIVPITESDNTHVSDNELLETVEDEKEIPENISTTVDDWN